MSDDSPRTVDEIEHLGESWELRMDSAGRPYGVIIGRGKIPVETYKRAKNHEPLPNFEL